MKRTLFGLAIWPLLAWGQKPVINPGGVVNAASYSTGLDLVVTGAVSTTLAGGSIATIFGTNLAASTQSAESTPLPRQLAGTAVSVDGIAAPLFYVSPTQVNFQMPSYYDTTPGISPANGIVVGTAAGMSDPYMTVITGPNPVPGIFTMDVSGCGQGAVLNASADGSTSLNSPTNSAAPGDYISIYGTGNGDDINNRPPDGVPASSNPLSSPEISAGPLFDFYENPGAGPSWSGRAPGFVGLDQFNSQVPETVRQGCAVPLQLIGYNIGPPVTISIASGGGTCVDPPTQGYGEIMWEKTVTTTVGLTTSITETDTLTVSLQASPGRQAPTPPVFTEGGLLAPAYTYYGPSCAIPGYRSLGAGTVTVQGPGLAATPAPMAPLQGGTVLANLPLPANGTQTPFQSGQVSGLTVYQATLPNGTIQQGSFKVSASGGSDVGAFQSTIQIGSPIQVVTALANRVLYAGQSYTITWTGGDSNAWVTVKLVSHEGAYDYYAWAWVARASDETITLTGQEPGLSFGSGGPLEMVIEVVPDPSQVPALSAPGLSLGGQHLWKYTYRFEGLTAQD
jgi:uncharacterized protein (TIGR03437 family)